MVKTTLILTGTGMPGAAEPAVLHARLSHGQGGVRRSCLPQLHTTVLGHVAFPVLGEAPSHCM